MSKWISQSMVALALGGLAASITACTTAALSPAGARVLTSQSAPVDHGYPPGNCKALGYFVGRGGGSFGGAWLSNDALVEYAMNDLRNKAAAAGANYVQHDSPQLGVAGSDGATNTTTATVSGTGYACSSPATTPSPQTSPQPSPQPAPAPSTVTALQQNGRTANAEPGAK